jgi:hypothetical protein
MGTASTSIMTDPCIAALCQAHNTQLQRTVMDKVPRHVRQRLPLNYSLFDNTGALNSSSAAGVGA